MLRTNELAGYGLNTAFNIDIVITTTRLNLDLVSLVSEYYPYWDRKSIISGKIYNASENIIGGNVQNEYSLICNLPLGSKVKFTNAGYIVGMGGRGANDNGYPVVGSPAIHVLTPIIFDNLLIIGGGGGGGGQAYWASGGGGAGHTPGAGGVGSASGYAGTLLTGGAGGTGRGKDGIGHGGNGGALGATGGTGSWDNSGGSRVGAAAGKAIVGNDLITWITAGDIRGVIQ